MSIAEAKAAMERQNPSVAPAKTSEERKRIPLSVPQRKLEVPPIPGYYLRWFRGTPQRLAQAERAGFIFVNYDEVDLNNLEIGGDATKTGNTDLGSRVSVIEGSEVDGGGQAVRMYLMKQLEEHRKEDNAIIEERNDSIASALTSQYKQGVVGGRDQGETAEDQAARYVDTKRTRVPGLFQKKVRKAG